MNEQLQSQFRLLVLDLLKLPDGAVRPAGITQPTEGGQFIIAEFSESDPIGTPSASHENDVQTAHQYNEITVTLDFFGKDAGQYAQQLPTALRLSMATERLDAMGLGFLSADRARNLTALELDRITRYQSKFYFSVVASISAPLLTINSVEIGLNVNQP